MRAGGAGVGAGIVEEPGGGLLAEGIVAFRDDAIEIKKSDALLDGDGPCPAGIGFTALTEMAGLPVAVRDRRAKDGRAAVGDGVDDDLPEVPAVGVDEFAFR